ncbi:MAG: SprT family zinc-dependent metalloprotease [Flavobacterium sp.]|nr:SprT family zinc-dependent metalloprotease [Flavobacterium sp.]
MTPTIEFYSLFQFIYDYFNKDLFNNELPNCMIVITRKTYTMGYYSNERWVNKDKKKTDELAMNPLYFSNRNFIEVLQTMAHEMCHVWQFHFGNTSRGGYHNKEWGNKMESIGLMPSNTGKVGGKKTGQQMMDYPIQNGVFFKSCFKLIENDIFETLWYDRTFKEKVENITSNHENVIPEFNNVDDKIVDLLYTPFQVETPIFESTQDSSKSKYQCPNCRTNIWGKRNLSIICGLCDSEYYNVE